MAQVDLGADAYKLKQIGDEVQEILDKANECISEDDAHKYTDNKVSNLKTSLDKTNTVVNELKADIKDLFKSTCEPYDVDLNNYGTYGAYGVAGHKNFPSNETAGVLCVFSGFDGIIQMFIPSTIHENDKIYLRSLFANNEGIYIPEREWTMVGGDIAQRLTGDNALYVYCDGDNDAAKINAALGENAAESAEKRIVYLVGECVLNASHLIADESNATKAYVIRPCANVVFDGTYCTSLTWDGSVEVDNSVQYRMFCFTAGQCGFQNMHIKYVNFDNTWYDPIFVHYEGDSDGNSFIMRDMIIDDMRAPKGNRFLAIVSPRSLVENVTFRHMVVYSRSTATQCMVFGSCDFVSNKFYGVNYSSTVYPYSVRFIKLSKYSRFENNYFKNVDGTAALRIELGNNSTFKKNAFYTCACTPMVQFQNGCSIKGNSYRDCTVTDNVFYAYSNAYATICDNIFEKITLGKVEGVISAEEGYVVNNKIHIFALTEGTQTPEYIIFVYGNDKCANIIGNTITFNQSIVLPENYAPINAYTEIDSNMFIEKNYTSAPALVTVDGDGNVVCKDNIITGAAQAE